MIETILYTYLCVIPIVWFASVLFIMSGEGFKEIDNFWDWLIYGILWGLFPIKALFKFIKNI